jgi:hypothetical protein
MGEVRDELVELRADLEGLRTSLHAAWQIIEGLNAQNGEVASRLASGDVEGAAKILRMDAGSFVPNDLD